MTESHGSGGCPLGWETEIFDIGMLKNSEVSWLSFAMLVDFALFA